MLPPVAVSRRAAEWWALSAAFVAFGAAGVFLLAREAVPFAAMRPWVVVLAALYALCAALAVLALGLAQKQRGRGFEVCPQGGVQRLESDEDVQRALSGADLGLWDLDVQSGRLNIDARGRAMLGHAPGEGIDHFGAWRALVHPDDAQVVNAAIEEHLGGRAPSCSVEHRSRHKHGHWVWLLSRAQVTVRDAGGAPLRMVGTQMDITLRKEAEFALQRANQQLGQLVHVDALTHLANRRMFDSTLRQEFARGSRDMEPLAVLMIDIDHFKPYNDRYGQVGGDQALSRVAGLLRHSAHRTGDLVARYGGEEFVILLPDTGLAGAQTVARRCVAAVAQARIPHEASPVAAWVTVSVGVAAVACDQRDNPMRLVRLAEEALQLAKQAGRDRCESAPAQAAAANAV